MRPPGFWQNAPRRPGWQARLLAPLGVIYAKETQRRLRQPPDIVPTRPVICVGNLTAGGAGKTPMVMWLLQLLEGAHVVSRGYGGRLTGPIQVASRHHGSDEVGDEPLLLSAFAPVWVAKNRAQGVKAAIEAGAKVVVLDDGFQNPTVAKTLNIVVVDAALGFGNGCVIPAGPLREPVAAGLARADMLVTIGDAPAQERFDETWGEQVDKMRAQAVLEPLQTGMDWNGLRALAFAGIGYPEKFFSTLRTLGVDIVQSHALDDHQPLNTALMARLSRQAAALDARLVTTEKDAVRLPDAYRTEVLTLPVRLRFDHEASVLDLLAKATGAQAQT